MTELNDIAETEMGSRQIDQSNDLDCPIDRGWAWIVMLAALCCNILSIANVKIFGLFFVEFINTYNASSSITSIIFGVFSVTFSVCAVVTLAVLPQYMQYRTIIMAGSLFNSAALLLSCFVTDVRYLILTFGVLFGVGISCMYGSSLVMVGHYFNKRRGIATSFALCGTSIGQFLMAPLMHYFVKKYALFGTLMIMGGILLHGVVFGLLMRPLSFYRKRNPFNQASHDGQTYKIRQTKANIGLYEEIQREPEAVTPIDMNEVNPQHTANAITQTSADININDATSYVQCPPHSVTLNSPMINSRVDNGCLCSHRHQLSNSDDFLQKKSPTTVIKNMLADIFELKLLRNRLFQIFLLGASLGATGVSLQISYLPSLSKERGFNDKTAATFVSVIGVSDLIGRLLSGALADTGYINPARIVVVAMFLSGLITAFSHLFHDYWLLAGYCVAIGFFGGVLFSLFTVILVDFLGLQKLSKAMGFNLLSQGLASGCFYPVFGLLRDVSGSYDTCFKVLAGCLLMSALSFSFTPCARNFERGLLSCRSIEFLNKPKRKKTK